MQPTGEPLIDHVRRVAVATPEFARPVAWLHEVLEWTSVSEEELLAEGVSDDELRARALRLILAAAAAQRRPSPDGAESPAA
jgi:hypothetical protein